MSIIRTEHNKNNPYVILNKSALEDKNLSWAAKGLWSYLMSRPDHWKVSVAHLSTIYDEKRGGGEKAIYSLLNELIEKGYCERKQERQEAGQFAKYEYIITELKNKVPHSPQADAVAPDAESSGAENRATSNKGHTVNKDCDQEKTTTKDVDDFFFTDKEREDLNNFSPEQIQQAKDVTNRDCVQKKNESRVKFFFKVLTTSIAKKPKMTVYEELCLHFKNLSSYNDATCYLNKDFITFERGMRNEPLSLKYFTWEKFQDLCNSFQIEFKRGI